MDILFLLIPLSVMLAFLIGAFFWRAVDTGQFDDLDTPALRIVADDDAPDGFVRDSSGDPVPAVRSSSGLMQIKPPAPRLFIIESVVNERKS